MKSSLFRTAFLDTVPVMTGYLFLGFGFGIALEQAGYGLIWAAAMSCSSTPGPCSMWPSACSAAAPVCSPPP